MLKKVLFILMSILSCGLSQDDAAKMEMYKKMVSAICVPNLPAGKAGIVAECEKIYPNTLKDVFSSCVKQAQGVAELTLPMFCYKALPNADKLKDCLKTREDEAASHGIVIDSKKKEEFKVKYMECMAKAM